MKLERMKLIRRLQQSILSFIYAHQKKKIAEEMYFLALQNQRLLGCNTNTFLYNGVWYSAGDPIKIRGTYRPNKVLHNDLKEKVISLLHKEFEATTQQSILHTHFGQVLITANRKDDLYKLLPYPLHKIIGMVDSAVYDCGDSLTPEEIKQFQKDNHDGIVCLNSMLLLDLLLSK